MKFAIACGEINDLHSGARPDRLATFVQHQPTQGPAGSSTKGGSQGNIKSPACTTCWDQPRTINSWVAPYQVCEDLRAPVSRDRNEYAGRVGGYAALVSSGSANSTRAWGFLAQLK